MSRTDALGMHLYRATVYALGMASEVTVFFEFPSWQATRMKPEQWLQTVLGGLWQMPDGEIGVSAVRTASDLLDAPGADTHQPVDVRLFAIGDWHGPIYAEPDATLMLVRPATLARLVAAQRALPIVDASATLPAPL